MMLALLDDKSTSTFVGLVGASLLKYGVSAWLATRQRPKVYEKVGRIAGLRLFPVKSCRGLEIQSAHCTKTGLHQHDVTDRHWSITSRHEDVINMNMEPKLALVSVKVLKDSVEMSAPGMEPLAVPIHPGLDRTWVRRIGSGTDYMDTLDCGDTAAAWFVKVTGRKGVRLNYSHPYLGKRDASDIQHTWTHYAQPGDQMAFANYCGYMLMTNESLALLNAELETPVDHGNFRPSIIMEGCPAFDEDNWEAVKIGQVTFRKLDKCSRCNQINVLQKEGKHPKDNEPFSTLRRIRSFPEYGPKPCIGIYLALDEEGDINVDDDVYAIRK